MSKNTPPQKTSIPVIHRARFNLFKSVLSPTCSLLLILLLVLAAGIFMLNLQGQITQSRVNLANLSHQITALSQENMHLLAEQEKTTASISSPLFSTQDALALTQSRALILSAHLYLTALNQPIAAIAYLNLAKKITKGGQSASLKSRYQAIEADLEMLSSQPDITPSNKLAQLQSLSENVLALPVEIIQPPHTPLDQDQNNAENKDWWATVKAHIAPLKSLIIVNKIDKNEKYVLLPDQKILLKQAVLLKLAEARWAVLNQNPRIYANALKTAHTLLTRFAGNGILIASIQKTLHALLVSNFNTYKPGAMRSFNLLTDSETKQSPPKSPTNNEKKEG